MAAAPICCVYVIDCHDGAVKVGQTADVRARLRTHRATMGSNFARCRIFRAPDRRAAAHIEGDVLRELKRIGQQVGRTEVFRGVGFQRALGIVREHVIAVSELRRRWRTQDNEFLAARRRMPVVYGLSMAA